MSLSAPFGAAMQPYQMTEEDDGPYAIIATDEFDPRDPPTGSIVDHATTHSAKHTHGLWTIASSDFYGGGGDGDHRDQDRLLPWPASPETTDDSDNDNDSLCCFDCVLSMAHAGGPVPAATNDDAANDSDGDDENTDTGAGGRNPHNNEGTGGGGSDATSAHMIDDSADPSVIVARYGGPAECFLRRAALVRCAERARHELNEALRKLLFGSSSSHHTVRMRGGERTKAAAAAAAFDVLAPYTHSSIAHHQYPYPPSQPPVVVTSATVLAMLPLVLQLCDALLQLGRTFEGVGEVLEECFYHQLYNSNHQQQQQEEEENTNSSNHSNNENDDHLHQNNNNNNDQHQGSNHQSTHPQPPRPSLIPTSRDAYDAFLLQIRHAMRCLQSTLRDGRNRNKNDAHHSEEEEGRALEAASDTIQRGFASQADKNTNSTSANKQHALCSHAPIPASLLRDPDNEALMLQWLSGAYNSTVHVDQTAMGEADCYAAAVACIGNTFSILQQLFSQQQQEQQQFIYAGSPAVADDEEEAIEDTFDDGDDDGGAPNTATTSSRNVLFYCLDRQARERVLSTAAKAWYALGVCLSELEEKVRNSEDEDDDGADVDDNDDTTTAASDTSEKKCVFSFTSASWLALNPLLLSLSPALTARWQKHAKRCCSHYHCSHPDHLDYNDDDGQNDDDDNHTWDSKGWLRQPHVAFDAHAVSFPFLAPCDPNSSQTTHAAKPMTHTCGSSKYNLSKGAVCAPSGDVYNLASAAIFGAQGCFMRAVECDPWLHNAWYNIGRRLRPGTETHARFARVVAGQRGDVEGDEEASTRGLRTGVIGLPASALRAMDHGRYAAGLDACPPQPSVPHLNASSAGTDMPAASSSWLRQHQKVVATGQHKDATSVIIRVLPEMFTISPAISPTVAADANASFPSDGEQQQAQQRMNRAQEAAIRRMMHSAISSTNSASSSYFYVCCSKVVAYASAVACDENTAARGWYNLACALGMAAEMTPEEEGPEDDVEEGTMIALSTAAALVPATRLQNALLEGANPRHFLPLPLPLHRQQRQTGVVDVLSPRRPSPIAIANALMNTNTSGTVTLPYVTETYCYAMTVSLAPDHAQAWNNLGLMLQQGAAVQAAAQATTAATTISQREEQEQQQRAQQEQQEEERERQQRIIRYEALSGQISEPAHNFTTAGGLDDVSSGAAKPAAVWIAGTRFTRVDCFLHAAAASTNIFVRSAEDIDDDEAEDHMPGDRDEHDDDDGAILESLNTSQSAAAGPPTSPTHLAPATPAGAPTSATSAPIAALPLVLRGGPPSAPVGGACVNAQGLPVTFAQYGPRATFDDHGHRHQQQSHHNQGRSRIVFDYQNVPAAACAWGNLAAELAAMREENSAGVEGVAAPLSVDSEFLASVLLPISPPEEDDEEEKSKPNKPQPVAAFLTASDCYARALEASGALQTIQEYIPTNTANTNNNRGNDDDAIEDSFHRRHGYDDYDHAPQRMAMMMVPPHDEDSLGLVRWADGLLQSGVNTAAMNAAAHTHSMPKDMGGVNGGDDDAAHFLCDYDYNEEEEEGWEPSRLGGGGGGGESGGCYQANTMYDEDDDHYEHNGHQDLPLVELRMCGRMVVTRLQEELAALRSLLYQSQGTTTTRAASTTTTTAASKPANIALPYFADSPFFIDGQPLTVPAAIRLLLGCYRQEQHHHRRGDPTDNRGSSSPQVEACAVLLAIHTILHSEPYQALTTALVTQNPQPVAPYFFFFCASAAAAAVDEIGTCKPVKTVPSTIMTYDTDDERKGLQPVLPSSIASSDDATTVVVSPETFEMHHHLHDNNYAMPSDGIGYHAHTGDITNSPAAMHTSPPLTRTIVDILPDVSHQSGLPSGTAIESRGGRSPSPTPPHQQHPFPLRDYHHHNHNGCLNASSRCLSDDLDSEYCANANFTSRFLIGTCAAAAAAPGANESSEIANTFSGKRALLASFSPSSPAKSSPGRLLLDPAAEAKARDYAFFCGTEANEAAESTAAPGPFRVPLSFPSSLCLSDPIPPAPHDADASTCTGTGMGTPHMDTDTFAGQDEVTASCPTVSAPTTASSLVEAQVEDATEKASHNEKNVAPPETAVPPAETSVEAVRALLACARRIRGGGSATNIKTTSGSGGAATDVAYARCRDGNGMASRMNADCSSQQQGSVAGPLSGMAAFLTRLQMAVDHVGHSFCENQHEDGEQERGGQREPQANITSTSGGGTRPHSRSPLVDIVRHLLRDTLLQKIATFSGE